MGREAAAASYAELPVPDTTEEAWRFTDLRGFDPDAFARDVDASSTAAPQLLDLDVAGLAVVTESGIEIERAPDGIRFEPLTEDDPRLYSLVGWDEKFAAHNAAVWKHGLLVHVPKGVVVEKPLYVRIASSVEESALFWRLLVIAEEQSQFTLIEEYSSARPDLAAYSNAVAELFVGQAAKFEYVSIQNLSQETWHFGTHHARVERDAPARLGRRRLRLEEREDPDPERPERARRDLAGDRRVLRRRQPAPRLRHLPGAHRALDRVRLQVQRARCASTRTPSGAG